MQPAPVLSALEGHQRPPIRKWMTPNRTRWPDSCSQLRLKRDNGLDIEDHDIADSAIKKDLGGAQIV